MNQDESTTKTNDLSDNQPERMTWATPMVQDLQIGKTASGPRAYVSEQFIYRPS